MDASNAAWEQDERWYIVHTNIARIRILRLVMQQLSVEPPITEDDYRTIALLLRKWEDSLEQEIEARYEDA